MRIVSFVFLAICYSWCIFGCSNEDDASFVECKAPFRCMGSDFCHNTGGKPATLPVDGGEFDCSSTQICCDFSDSNDGDAGTDTESDSGADGDTDSDTDADADTDADTDGDSDSDTDTETNGDSESEADTEVESGLDFGDAPQKGSCKYPTRLSQNGAHHQTSVTLFLGNKVDSETDGQPTSAADGDDSADGNDDEDGVEFPDSIVEGEVAAVEIKVNNATGASAMLNAWIDFNQDCDWDDEGEHIFVNLAVSSGTTSLSFPVPDGTDGETYARFRLSSQPNITAEGGPAPDGEVEDYEIQIEKD